MELGPAESSSLRTRVLSAVGRSAPSLSLVSRAWCHHAKPPSAPWRILRAGNGALSPHFLRTSFQCVVGASRAGVPVRGSRPAVLAWSRARRQGGGGGVPCRQASPCTALLPPQRLLACVQPAGLRDKAASVRPGPESPGRHGARAVGKVSEHSAPACLSPRSHVLAASSVRTPANGKSENSEWLSAARQPPLPSPHSPGRWTLLEPVPVDSPQEQTL